MMSNENTFDKRCLASQPPKELSFASSIISIVLTLTNIPGNILIVLAVVLNPNKNLRTPFNWLVVNLATADLIVGFITEPIVSYFTMQESLEGKLLVKELKTIHITYFIPCTASLLSIISLAIERYLAVRKPITYRAQVTNKRIVFTVVVIWLISFTLPNMYLIFGFPAFGFIFSNACVVIAVPVMCITYALIKRKVKPRSGRRSSYAQVAKQEIKMANESERVLDMRRATPENGGTLQTNTTAVPSSTNTISSQYTSISSQLLEKKITKMFLIVLIVLLCCYGSSTIMMYFVNYCEVCSCATLHVLRDVSILTVLSNSSVNFFCYALRCSRFRSAFVKLLRLNRNETPGSTPSEVN